MKFIYKFFELPFFNHSLLFVFSSFGQYIVYTLNTGLNTESNLKVEEFESRTKTMDGCNELTNEEKTICVILLRNRCLQLMHCLLFTNKNLICTGYLSI